MFGHHSIKVERPIINSEPEIFLRLSAKLPRMTIQLAVRIPEELAQQLDGLVRDGVVANRADGVRRGLRALVQAEQRARVDAAIIAGYQRIPPTDAEKRWAEASGREMIAEEPW